MRIVPHRGLAILALSAGLAACATTKPAVESSQGLDLGLVGPETPPSLSELSKAPYALPADLDCAGVWAQVRGLDALLGPDVDTPAPEGSRVANAITSLVRGAVPYRGVIRWASGAARREQARAHAVLAGSARRGFLKGVARQRGCVEPPQAKVQPNG